MVDPVPKLARPEFLQADGQHFGFQLVAGQADKIFAPVGIDSRQGKGVCVVGGAHGPLNKARSVQSQKTK